jgi:nicotinamide-nucleotide amidase
MGVKKKAEETVAALGDALRRRGWRMATAESCTGGLVASTLTDVAGSSDWFEGGVVAYDNRVKMRLLGVPEEVLVRDGAVSRACVEAMVRGVCGLMGVQAGVAVSGIAGPSGGTPGKPVGTVWVAWMADGRVWSSVFLFRGSRREIKGQSMLAALAGLELA